MRRRKHVLREELDRGQCAAAVGFVVLTFGWLAIAITIVLQ